MIYRDLHELLKAKNITQVDIMKACNLSKGTVSKVVSGKIEGTSVDNLVKIAHFLKLPVSYYFDESDHPQVQEPAGEYKKMSDLVIETQKKMIKNLEEELSRLSAEKKESKCV